MTPFPTPADADSSEQMSANFTKHYLPDGRVLHHFKAANDQDFHDHPFSFTSLIGPKETDGYVEEILVPWAHGPGWMIERHERLPGSTHRVEAGTIHRLISLRGPECWTVIAPEVKEREPGFYRARDCGRYVEHRFWNEKDWHPWPRETEQNISAEHSPK